MKNHVENSKKFELDKLLIKKIYNIPDKKKPEYKVIKKNVVYDKQLTRQYFTYSNINKDNYFCNYQSFRDYLSSGYDYYFLVNELSNIRSILDISHNIREIVNKKLNNNKAPKKHLYNQTQEKIDEMNNSISNQLIQKLNSNNRRPSTVFQLDKDNPLVKRMSNMTHKNSITNQNIQKINNYNPRLNEEEINNTKFIEKCHLLKKKEEEENLPKNQYHFRLYSMLSEEFDKFNLPVYEDFINVKYENQKNVLIEIYNKERAFTNRAIQMKEKIKLLAKESKMKLKKNQENNSGSIDFNNSRQNINPLPDINLREIAQDTYETKVPYITSFFFGRSELYFKEIDNFMSMYKEKTSFASKQLEKDFFENLYKILTFNNTDCKKFFHYLYSNSYFFKYIYNIFTTNNKSDDSLKNIAPSIKRHNDDEPFLNESQKESFFPGAREKIIDENKYIIMQKKPDENNNEQEEDLKQKEIDEFFDSLIGNDFIYQISLIQEDVSELVDKKKIKKFKKIITSNERYEDNFIITLNNEDNMLQIYNTKENQYLFSFYFDENISFYDLDKDLNNNLKSDKIQPNQKYILIIQKNNFSNYNNSYVFKLNQDIYTRFIKSISSKGNKIKKIELFSSEENEQNNNINININEKDKDKDNDEDKKLKLEDILSLKGNTTKNQNESQDSEKHSSSKNDNNIKFDQRNPSRSISFRKNSVNKSNSGNEKSENEEKEKKEKKKNETNNDINKEKEEEDENEEEEDDEENEDNEEEEDNEDNDEEKEKEKDKNISNKIKNINLKKEKSEEEENSEKDNINNKFSEEKKSEGSDDNNNNNNNEKKLNLNLNNKKLKNLGEEIDDPVFKNNQTIESQPKSLENEE